MLIKTPVILSTLNSLNIAINELNVINSYISSLNQQLDLLVNNLNDTLLIDKRIVDDEKFKKIKNNNLSISDKINDSIIPRIGE